MPLFMFGGLIIWARRALQKRASHPEGRLASDIPAEPSSRNSV
jgi:hypothetical protein